MDSQFLSFLFFVAAAGVCCKSLPVFAAWLRARRAKAPLRLLTLWGVYLRNVPLDPLVDASICARRAGVRICLREMISHAQAGGDLRAVVRAYIETLRGGSSIDFTRVCEIELSAAAGEDS